MAFLSGRPVFLTRVSRCGLTLVRHAKKGRWNERAKVCLALMTSLFLMSDSSYEWAFGWTYILCKHDTIIPSNM